MNFVKRCIAPLLALLGIHECLSAQQKQDLTQAAYQTAPGLTASAGTAVLGWPLSAWLTLVSIIYVVAQLAHLVWKWRRQARIDAARAAAGQDLQGTGWGKL
ncbi:hypothetical protein [Corticibacter populi]|nr:hypothetical protein [Corticibacter populi]